MIVKGFGTLIFCCGLGNCLNAQGAFLGLKLGIALGSHQQSFAVGVHATGYSWNLMASVGSDVSFSLNSLGERRNLWEWRTYVGGAWKSKPILGSGDFELGTLKNPLDRSNSLGYAYLIYLDNAGTSQRSGALRTEFYGHSLYFENDFFAGQGRDRYRTAVVTYRYRRDLWIVKLGIILWTGETSGLRNQDTLINGRPYNFKNLSSTPYGRSSHGILVIGTHYGGMGNSLGVEMGMDSEKLRDVVQNQLAHSAVWHRRNPRNAVSYPPLDSSGYPAFTSSKIRRPQPYFRVSLSED